MTAKPLTVADVLAGDDWMFCEEEFEDPESEPSFPWWARPLPPAWWSEE
jgi:hypothetical protein